MLKAVLIASITCVLVIISIVFFPKIKIKKITLKPYIIVSIIGAIFMLLLKVVDFKDIYNAIISSDSVNPVKILALFFSMTIISIYLDEVGFFKYLAYKSTRLAKKSQISLFLIIYAFASILTIFTSNDIVILTFIPFICYFCKNANINPIPYLVSCFVGANTWSMMLIIGNPTNIYLATSYGIDFLEYVKIMALPTLLAGIVEILILLLLFRKSLKHEMIVVEEKYTIESKFDLIIGVIHLVVCLIFLVISSYIHVEMYLISVICAGSLILINLVSSIIKKKKPSDLINTVKRLPYELIFFVLSMFVIVEGLRLSGFTQEIYNFFGVGYEIYKYGYSSFIVCNLINNIPMSVLYASIPNLTEGAIYASIIGSNIGAFLTPIGALAGIMFTNLLQKQEVKYSFLGFIKYGVIISIPTISVALVSLSIFV
ncbi:MAG: hypothetical protein K5765_06280 [Clostridia bacterium]|nr:hypothetical protein [Clostridia bacterium]